MEKGNVFLKFILKENVLAHLERPEKDARPLMKGSGVGAHVFFECCIVFMSSAANKNSEQALPISNLE